MALSFWERDYYGQIDFAILGCGIVGLSTAIHLKQTQPEANIVVIDRSWPPHGASTKNAGFVCFGSPTEILDDIQQNGPVTAMNIFEKRWLGRETLFSMIDTTNLDYQQIGGLELFENADLPEKEEIDYLNQLIYSKIGIKDYFEYVENNSFLNFNQKAILAQKEGRINPMKLILTLKNIADQLGIKFLFKEVKSIDRTNNGLVLDQDTVLPYRKLLVTLNAFAAKLFQELQDVKAARNVVLVTSPLKYFNINHVIHIDKGYVYMRMIGNRILLGGARNKFLNTEYTDEISVNAEIVSYLKDYLKHKFDIKEAFTIEAAWSGILGVGSNKNPIIEKLDEHIYVGVRMGGMGVAIGALVGKQLAELSASQ
ncbi:MAG TPA: FAD-dependent oxidoreductase [Saprospiraceae bacterium]|nr:FAD-dependent oxidoreductase [Saprospiraceae bacterium]HPN69686.1 FAD-dependent oxidoreductase [Saprospiraceae bacterium]